MIRYISHPDLATNQIYLQEWADQIQTWLVQGKKVYFFVHYHARNAGCGRPTPTLEPTD